MTARRKHSTVEASKAPRRERRAFPEEFKREAVRLLHGGDAGWCHRRGARIRPYHSYFVRIALGATSARIASAVAHRGAALAIAGAMAGLVAALWGTKVIEHELHGVSRLDLPSFIVGAAVLLFAAAMACVVPARRAIRIDPMSAIRSD